ncbi:MAG: hypothetical protein Q8K81_08900, partial [Sulfuricurvum sp.]|nr:hypothetical protein [Sulfuricurvum sp.]
VAFQVIEMFYVTTPYSKWCKRNGFRIIAASLTLKTVWLFLALPYLWLFDLILAALLTGFVVTTLHRLRERKRRVSDVSIWFWNTGMVLLLFSLMAHAGYLWSSKTEFETTALIAFSLFSLSVILGMMSKIVPFLVWFHLSSSGYIDTPIMSNIIPAQRNKALYILFVFTLLFALGSPFYPLFLSVAGGSFFLLFGLLGVNLIRAVRLYQHTRATGKHFSMSTDSDTASTL